MSQSASDLFAPPDQKLFDEFESVNRQQWQAEIDKILEKQGKAGRDLSWQLSENISLPSFLLAEDLRQLRFTEDRCGVYPFTRSTNLNGQPWSIQMPVQSNSGSGSLTDKLTEAKDRGADGATIFVGNDSNVLPYGQGYSVNHILKANLASFEMNIQLLGNTTDLLQIAESEKKFTILADLFQDVLVNGNFATQPKDFYS
ncbi:MAG: hypothetical protein H3C43_02975, partial [Leptonema sp. (in: Bacteria)]|nr:hypothetical protein [Leptonema sp. (in: bacteria)]